MTIVKYKVVASPRTLPEINTPRQGPFTANATIVLRTARSGTLSIKEVTAFNPGLIDTTHRFFQNAANSHSPFETHEGFCCGFTNPPVTSRDREVQAKDLFSFSISAAIPLVEMGAHHSVMDILGDGHATHRAKGYAGEAFVNLTLEAANRDRLVQDDVDYLLMRLLADPDATTKEYAAMALANLTADTANHLRLNFAGVHKSLMDLLDDQKATHGAKENAARALTHLVLNTENQQFLLQEGVHISLCLFLLDQQATHGAKEDAAKALANLAEEGANRQHLVNQGVHISLCLLLLDPQATPRATEYAARALLFLSFHIANRKRLVEAGVHIQLMDLQANQKATDSAKEYATTALAALNCSQVGLM